ncbi:MAG: radical SAM protein [Peptococcaceae bacterium]|jgi:nitrogen fixation protein NifB|nr:radical SAM protein [Peptococcaceae bacterium]
MIHASDSAGEHPCFHKAAARWFGRVHLPVAPACNIQCNYCSRLYDCANENRPGVTSRVMSPRQALRHVRQTLARDQRIRVVGVAGPGEPLANEATFLTLHLVHREFPETVKCVSTNGLLLEQSLPALRAAGVRTVTVTVNAVSAAAGAMIYQYALLGEEVYRGKEAAGLLWERQRRGIRLAASMGLAVKVNSVLIPGVNEGEMPLIAGQVKAAGAQIMNVIPMIPQGAFVMMPAPTAGQVGELRRKLDPVISQMTHCQRCRADAGGLLGEGAGTGGLCGGADQGSGC